MGKILRNGIEYHFAGPISYNDLHNHPSINGVELVGNKTSEDLGLMTAAEVEEAIEETPVHTVAINPTPEEQATMNFWIVDDEE